VELLVVIIGIAMAFMVNRFYENRKNIKLERQYLRSVLGGIAADETAMDTHRFVRTK